MIELRRKKATKIYNEGNDSVVRLYNTDVVRFGQKKIKLSTGGFFTSTTKNRMNQASNEFGLGYHVKQEKNKWYAYHKGKKKAFQNGFLEFDR